jgi:glutamyl-tRNA synthetase
MSKRDQGAAVSSYIEGGYAPEAVRNYICLLGWSPKDDREKLDLQEVVERFDFANVNRKKRAVRPGEMQLAERAISHHMPLERYVELGRPWLEKAGIPCGDDAQLAPILALVKEKVKFLTELPDWVGSSSPRSILFSPTQRRSSGSPALWIVCGNSARLSGR